MNPDLIHNIDTIVALATPPGTSAIAVIRVSGEKAIDICNQVFVGKDLGQQSTHTIHHGHISDGKKTIDEVLVSIFVAPHSYTKDNSVEISCHGSNFVIQQIIQLLLKKGARLAQPGEFTKRAFLNGQFDLAQAEAVADIIASDSEASHQAAMNQMRGGFSKQIKHLREELVHFASMIELELDFSQEDVEFASRKDLKRLIDQLLEVINPLIESFKLGNVIKNGVPTVIAGKPNAGKSTLLNILLNEDRAIVSHIAGTTRDMIEDEINLGGINFRFIDTAGLRDTEDTIEKIGVERTKKKMEQASLILYLFDLGEENLREIGKQLNQLENQSVPFIPIGNKLDKAPAPLLKKLEKQNCFIFISALQHQHIDQLKEAILQKVNLDSFKTGNTMVTNLRHYQSLVETKTSLEAAIKGLEEGLTNDLLAEDIRQALFHLGEITGEITTEDLLENIFRKFCIGK